jgi:hypothetical protein
MVETAKIVPMSIEGKPDAAIANELWLRPNKVGMWRLRFIEHWIEDLFVFPRPGPPLKYDPIETRKCCFKNIGNSNAT